jgi:hypothetical protein
LGVLRVSPLLEWHVPTGGGPWIIVIQPYEDYGLQKYVEFTPSPNQQLEVRRFNFRLRRA